MSMTNRWSAPSRAAWKNHQFAFGLVSKSGRLEAHQAHCACGQVPSQKLPAHPPSGKPKKRPKVIQGEGPVGRLKPLKGPPAIGSTTPFSSAATRSKLRMPKRSFLATGMGAPLKFAVLVNDSDSGGKEKQSYAPDLRR